ncbi:hypothetical protein RRG08_024989 [Elysia crispata]|uniref:Uncharacterized protein n=1 Tax=Elysia crispata TaxID=231223 RepID=A0AAE1ASN6_9GAST|nr:hypothetical protein RRG08_024989 [Elysia crispata]
MRMLFEKKEKLVTSDLRRSQTVLLNKLERLQRKQESINAGKALEPDTRLTQRRYSTSFVSFDRLSSPTRKMRREIGTHHMRRSSGNESDMDVLDISRETSNLPSPRCEKSFIRNRNSGNSSRTVSPDMKEARRLSFVAQEETSRKALEKLDVLVNEHKRRATIATGAFHPEGLLPSASDIARPAEIAKRSISTEEEDNFLRDRSDDSEAQSEVHFNDRH